MYIFLFFLNFFFFELSGGSTCPAAVFTQCGDQAQVFMVDGMRRFTRQAVSLAPVQLSIFFLLPFLPFLPFLFKVSYVYYYGWA